MSIVPAVEGNPSAAAAATAATETSRITQFHAQFLCHRTLQWMIIKERVQCSTAAENQPYLKLTEPMHGHTMCAMRTALLLLGSVASAAAVFFLTVHAAAAAPGHNLAVSCLPQERDALLAFKRGITGDPAGRLDSWTEAEEDCCRWRGVRCSNRTGHVLGLHLRNNFPNMDIRNMDDDAPDPGLTALAGQISPSLLSLQHLEHLDLSANNISGPAGHVPEFLGLLKNLRYLNLSSMPLYGRVPPHIGNLSNLHYLDLSTNPSVLRSWNPDMNSTDITWLSNLPLRYLDLGHVNLSMIVDWSQALNTVPSLKVLRLPYCSLTSANLYLPHLNLTKLERLVLSGNHFDHPVASCWFWNLTNLQYLEVRRTQLNGQFPYALGVMTLLRVLDFSSSYEGIEIIGKTLDIMTANLTKLCNLEILNLRYCHSNGSIIELFDRLPQCPMNKLKELRLGGNNFTGVLSDWVGRWTSLITLDLSNNQITGKLPSEIGMLGNLTELYLGGNNLNGLVTHKHFDGLKRLTVLDLSYNSLKFVVDPKWSPPFRLQHAYLSSCDMGPQFPTWLRQQVDILELQMSDAAISGNLPEWFCSTFLNAWTLDISNNQINGTLPANMEVLESLRIFDLTSNQLTGHLPKFPNRLKALVISRNSLSGHLPSNFGAPFIEDLRLFSNNISGRIPPYMCQLKHLYFLDLSDNLFDGELPSCFQPNSLEVLAASNNRLTGKFPPSLQKCKNLSVLILTLNYFSGELPVWIGDLINLEIVELKYNNFSGSIPATITNLTKLHNLNLAGNSISGVLPWNLANLKGMTARGSPVILRHNVSFGNIVLMPVVNLTVDTKGNAHNYIPRGSSDMVSIDLSSNFLTGEIPEEITSLDALKNLNLSWNHFSGKIPAKTGVMQSLESLDLSKNKLVGELPQSLSNLTYLSYLDVSHNNLTGRIPSGGQLDTLYAENPFMYDGNIGLCGYPLQKNCSDNTAPKHDDHRTDEHYYSGLISFPFGLGIGYMVGLWSVFCVILFKESWRIAYIRLLDKVCDNVYVFVVVTWTRWTQKASTK